MKTPQEWLAEFSKFSQCGGTDEMLHLIARIQDDALAVTHVRCAVPSPVGAQRKPRSVEEVIQKGQFIGISEQDCRDWFRDQEACGWVRGDGTPVDHWPRALVLHRDRLRSRALTPAGRPTTIHELRTVLQLKEERANALRERHASQGALSTDWHNESARQEYLTLRKEIKEIKARIEKAL